MDVPKLFGPYGSAALAHARQLSSHGANAAWFHMFDADAFDACARHGLAACVEFKTFRADFDERPELFPIGVDGKPIRHGRLVQGVCLSQEAFLAEIEANLVVGLQAFKPAGIWLDYLTYGGWFETPAPDLQESCFCDACIADFCEVVGVDADRPSAILAHHRAAWTRRKCRRVAGFAARYSNMIRSALPDCFIGAYMCPWTPNEFDGALTRIFAQEYDLLAPYIDVFTPLIYAHKSGRPPSWAGEFLDSAPGFIPANSKVQLILDVLDYPDSLVSTVESSRPGWGVQIFGGAEIFADVEKAQIFEQLIARWPS